MGGSVARAPSGGRAVAARSIVLAGCFGKENVHWSVSFSASRSGMVRMDAHPTLADGFSIVGKPT